MPNWHEILNELKRSGSTHDIIRRKYLKRLNTMTGRNVIVYYSGWLQKPDQPGTELSDVDKNGFMTVIHNLDPTKGLDLVLHTPGGQAAATESLVTYLHSIFDTNIRAIVPQLALSAGTMIACACRTIIMGQHSSLGPIDPQMRRGIPAHGVVEEFETAHKEIKLDPSKIPVWQPIIANYGPALIGECEKAITWANAMVKEWLLKGMIPEMVRKGLISDDVNKEEIADNIIKELADHALTLSHARHLSIEKCKSIGLNVATLEEDPKLQDTVLSVHHSCMHTLQSKNAYKIIENHKGIAYILVTQQMLVAR